MLYIWSQYILVYGVPSQLSSFAITLGTLGFIVNILLFLLFTALVFIVVINIMTGNTKFYK
jgi:hypothetical protein